MPPLQADIAVVGAGAAGLMAAIAAGRAPGHHPHRARSASIVVLDGARVLGAKILVAGGGRCNVTHHAVDETAYAGSTRPAIRKVLRAFDVAQTIEFFRDLGVNLKREPTGKLFPTTDDAHTVLDALLGECRRLGVRLVYPWRVDRLTRTAHGFLAVRAPTAPTRDTHIPCPDSPDQVLARAVILATGGMALPRTGSDGHGYTLARALGHTVTERITPALVPLTLPPDHPLRTLSGLSVPARLTLVGPTGRHRKTFTGPVLCTHFGLSGPAVLDISRYWLEARAEQTGSRVLASFMPDLSHETLDAELAGARRLSPLRFFESRVPDLPERLVRVLCSIAGVDPVAPCDHLDRARRKALVTAFCTLELPITGDRGFTFAEATAGGVPLSELHLETMASRRCQGLFIAGELLDVDGRIGGFNFQWAWSSGHVAGSAAARSVLDPTADTRDHHVG
jgi:predicted Rossmann fold flavoprotein